MRNALRALLLVLVVVVLPATAIFGAAVRQSIINRHGAREMACHSGQNCATPSNAEMECHGVKCAAPLGTAMACHGPKCAAPSEIECNGVRCPEPSNAEMACKSGPKCATHGSAAEPVGGSLAGTVGPRSIGPDSDYHSWRSC